jgi:hypothetical protein
LASALNRLTETVLFFLDFRQPISFQLPTG